MNKIFTSILALACAGMAYANGFTLTYEGAEVVSGSTINVGYNLEREIFATWTPKFEIKANNETNIVLVGTSDNEALQEYFQDCSFGQCKSAPFKNTYPLKAGVAEHLEIHRMLRPLPVATTEGDFAGILTVYEENNPDAKVTVTINFLVKPAEEVGGVDNVAVNGEFVRLESGNSLSYSVNGKEHLEVYSILGTRLVDRAISGHGSVDLNGLGRGVYIYRAGRISGKIVVK